MSLVCMSTDKGLNKRAAIDKIVEIKWDLFFKRRHRLVFPKHELQITLTLRILLFQTRKV